MMKRFITTIFMAYAVMMACVPANAMQYGSGRPPVPLHAQHAQEAPSYGARGALTVSRTNSGVRVLSPTYRWNNVQHGCQQNDFIAELMDAARDADPFLERNFGRRLIAGARGLVGENVLHWVMFGSDRTCNSKRDWLIGYLLYYYPFLRLAHDFDGCTPDAWALRNGRIANYYCMERHLCNQEENRVGVAIEREENDERRQIKRDFQQKACEITEQENMWSEEMRQRRYETNEKLAQRRQAYHAYRDAKRAAGDAHQAWWRALGTARESGEQSCMALEDRVLQRAAQKRQRLRAERNQEKKERALMGQAFAASVDREEQEKRAAIGEAREREKERKKEEKRSREKEKQEAAEKRKQERRAIEQQKNERKASKKKKESQSEVLARYIETGMFDDALTMIPTLSKKDLESEVSGKTIIERAVESKAACVVQALYQRNIKLGVGKDSQGNKDTLAHVAARGGDAATFKAVLLHKNAQSWLIRKNRNGLIPLNLINERAEVDKDFLVSQTIIAQIKKRPLFKAIWEAKQESQDDREGILNLIERHKDKPDQLYISQGALTPLHVVLLRTKLDEARLEQRYTQEEIDFECWALRQLSPHSTLDEETAGGQTALHIATEMRLSSQMLVLLDAGASLDEETFRLIDKGSDGEKMLKLVKEIHEARSSLKEELVKQIILGRYPLMTSALVCDRVDLVKRLFACGWQEQGEEKTLLHMAATCAASQCIAYLVNERGYDPRVVNKRGDTPLHLYVGSPYRRHNKEIVRLLIDGYGMANHSGKKPIHLAADSNNGLALRYLKEIDPQGYAADALAQDENGSTPFILLLVKGCEDKEALQSLIAGRNYITKIGSNALHAAAFSNNYVAFRYLQEVDPQRYAADALVQDVEGCTPFIFLVFRGGKDKEVLQSLIAGRNYITRCGNNALHTAALVGNEEAFRVLLDDSVEKFKLEAQKKNDCGHTPLHCLVQSGCDADTMKRLLAMLYPMGSEVQDEEGLLPIHIAASVGNCVALEWMKQDLMCADGKSNYLPIHCAVSKGQREAVRYMVEKGGVPVDTPTLYQGLTPLMIAANLCLPEMVQDLLNLGADIKKKSRNGNDVSKFLPPLEVGSDNSDHTQKIRATAQALGINLQSQSTAQQDASLVYIGIGREGRVIESQPSPSRGRKRGGAR